MGGKKEHLFLKLCLPFPSGHVLQTLSCLVTAVLLGGQAPRKVTLLTQRSGGEGDVMLFFWFCVLFWGFLCISKAAAAANGSRNGRPSVRGARCRFPMRVFPPLCFISPASPAFLLDSFSVFNLDSKGTRSECGQGVRITPESTKVSFNSAVSFSPLSTLPACDLTSRFRYPK